MTRTIAVYGTLKKGRKYELLKDPYLKGIFLHNTKIKNAQLHVNKEKTYWPIVSDGKNLVDCEVYEVDEATFQDLKEGEEANKYHTRYITLQNGLQAFAWFYDDALVNEDWKSVKEY